MTRLAVAGVSSAAHQFRRMALSTSRSKIVPKNATSSRVVGVFLYL
jgi:hypothetical protein